MDLAQPASFFRYYHDFLIIEVSMLFLFSSCFFLSPFHDARSFFVLAFSRVGAVAFLRGSHFISLFLWLSGKASQLEPQEKNSTPALL